ncbi:MAG: nicotinate-nucleotide adenylyltransferase [Butyrivibrio sp.]|nr:nicotinate-nucleotide adenylyltransferase [Butyrivibrio sp.]
MKSRKIGIMGGTFNPIHYGHLLLAETAREQFGLDRVIFIPTGVSYLKKDDNIPSGDIRYQLVKTAIQDNPYFTCSRIEIDREGNTYSIDTICELQKMYPGDELYFIVGADTLLTMNKWKDIDNIFSKVIVLAAIRDDNEIPELDNVRQDYMNKYNANIQFIHFKRIDISSTDIRNRISIGRSVKYLLPDECIEFCCLKNLYSSRNNTVVDYDDIKVYKK